MATVSVDTISLQEDSWPKSIDLIQRLAVAWRCSRFITKRPAVADKPARRLRKVCTVYVRAVGL